MDEALAEQAMKMLNRLVDMVAGYAKDRNRVRSLVLFAERKPRNGSPAVRKVSRAHWNDRPEVELLLTHRDTVLSINGLLKVAQKQMEVATDPSVADSILGRIAALEDDKHQAMKQITRILESIAGEQATREAMMVKLATDGARLAQAALHHQDKQDPEAKAGTNVEKLKERLARKYGVSVERVEELLSNDPRRN